MIDLKTFGDERGFLTPIEGAKDIPFEIKRVFFIHGTKGKQFLRGNHANRKTKFVLVMPAGSCKIRIYNDKGTVEEIVELNTPNKGLYLENMIFKEIYDFSDDAIMLALASEQFDAEEYIDTYEEFLEENDD